MTIRKMRCIDGPHAGDLVEIDWPLCDKVILVKATKGDALSLSELQQAAMMFPTLENMKQVFGEQIQKTTYRVCGDHLEMVTRTRSVEHK